MFRLIKKWYFKIYHLFKLLGIFILILGVKNVYAEECNVIYKETGDKLLAYGVGGDYWVYSSINSTDIYNPSLDNTKSYTMFITDSEGNIYNMNNLNFVRAYLVGNMFIGTNYKKESITATPVTSPGSIFAFYGYNNANATTSYQKLIDKYIYVVEGENICFPSETPEPEESVYNTFLGLYVGKIQYLAEGFIENEYLFSMVAIIFAWVVLEMFLRILHLRGGYKK